MVKASERFGAPPVCCAWLITVSVSAFHHSPAKYDGDFFVGMRKWVRDMWLGEDDNGSIESGSEP